MKPTSPIKPAASPVLSFGFQVNTRLVAAVQNNAGAHCHTSANLVQSYYFCAEVYRVLLRKNDPLAAEDARRGVQRAEVRLREFLTDRMWDHAIQRPFVLGRAGRARDAGAEGN